MQGAVYVINVKKPQNKLRKSSPLVRKLKGKIKLCFLRLKSNKIGAAK